MLKLTGEINILKYESGLTTTTISSRFFDREKGEVVKDTNGEVKRIFREIIVNFVGAAKDISDCFNHTKIKVDNGWLDFYIDKDNNTKWKLMVSQAEVLQQGEGYKPMRNLSAKQNEEKNEESPFAIGNADDLPF